MGFTSLPAELRARIYLHLFTIDDQKRKYVNLKDLHQSDLCWVWHALEISREFRSEGGKVLFGNHLWTIPIAVTNKSSLYASHWQRTQFMEDFHYGLLVAALPLPKDGKGLVSRPTRSRARMIQVTNGTPQLFFRNLLPSEGPVFEVYETTFPRQSWDIASLFKHVRFEAWDHTAPQGDPLKLRYVLQFAAEIVNAKLPNLVSAELDIKLPLLQHFHQYRHGLASQADHVDELQRTLRETPVSVKRFTVSGMTDLYPGDPKLQRASGLLNDVPTPQEKLEIHGAYVTKICHDLQGCVRLVG